VYLPEHVIAACECETELIVEFASFLVALSLPPLADFSQIAVGGRFGDVECPAESEYGVFGVVAVEQCPFQRGDVLFAFVPTSSITWHLIYLESESVVPHPAEAVTSVATETFVAVTTPTFLGVANRINPRAASRPTGAGRTW